MPPIVAGRRFTVRGTYALTLGILARVVGRIVGIFILEVVAVGLLDLILKLSLGAVSPVLVAVLKFLVQQSAATIVSGTLVAFCYAAAEGRRCGFGEALAAAGRRFGPLFVVCLLQAVAVALGLVLLIVPGLVIAMLLAAAAPICMIEHVGPFESLSRSAALTVGVRWRLFGVLALPLLVAIPAFAALLAPIHHVDALTISLAAVGGLGLLALFLMVLVLPTAIYVALRDARSHRDLGPASPSAL